MSDYLTLPQRKHPRLKRFDYDTNARYFVTICTYHKAKILSTVKVGRGLAPAATCLTEVGSIIEDELLLLLSRFPDLTIEKYVIMPNHVHAILTVVASAAGASPRPTLMDMVCAFKSLCTRRCKRDGVMDDKLWQTSFYDHIIRNEHDYKNIWDYIENNPARWAEDPCFYENV